MSKTQPVPAQPPQTPAPQDGARRRYHASVPIEYRESGEDEKAPSKTWWHPLGVAFERDAKDGKPPFISIVLNAVPAGGADGRVRFCLFQDDGRRRERAADARDSSPREDDDGIPF